MKDVSKKYSTKKGHLLNNSFLNTWFFIVRIHLLIYFDSKICCSFHRNFIAKLMFQKFGLWGTLSISKIWSSVVFGIFSYKFLNLCYILNPNTHLKRNTDRWSEAGDWFFFQIKSTQCLCQQRQGIVFWACLYHCKGKGLLELKISKCCIITRCNAKMYF